jgi:anthranilate/para-aminobenzoate synthase component I
MPAPAAREARAVDANRATERSVLQSISPSTLARRWPGETPLLLLGSFASHDLAVGSTAGEHASASNAARWSRWSIAGVPGSWQTLSSADLGLDLLDETDAAYVGKWRERQDECRSRVRAFLSGVLPPVAPRSSLTGKVGRGGADEASRVPVAPFSVVVMSYELGRVLEASPTPRDQRPPRRLAPSTPLIAACRLEESLCHDRVRNQWSRLGATPGASKLSEVIAHLARPQSIPQLARAYELSRVNVSVGGGAEVDATARERYEHAVARAVRLIRDGDLFQVNLAHPLTATFRGDHRELFADLARTAAPWFGALLELPAPWPTVLSASPELLLEFEPTTRTLTTRPIKGTRPRSADPRELLASSKDRAELNMITDLMRNDLGRVARPGSVRVESTSEVETHRVHHTVATIAATLRDDASPVDALLACFPGGSITGAPKVRAMQVIEELETHPRGVYCGCIAIADATGRLVTNIAIRTISLGPADAAGQRTLVYPVGAGIVADSVPASEYEETIAKADALMQLMQH